MTSNKSMQIRYCTHNCLMDSFPSMIWLSDTTKMCTFFNNAWLNFVGNTLESQLNNGWTNYVHPEDLQHCVRTYQTAFDKREKFEMEYRLKYKNDTYRWIYDIGTPNYQDGNFVGYIGVCVDIDDKVKYKKLLSDNEQLYRKLFDSMSEPVILFDTETFRIIDVNPAAIRKYGYSRFEFLTMYVVELSSQTELSKKYIENKETYTPLRYHKNKDGFIFPVEISTSYFKVNNKEFSVNIVRDTVDRTK